MMKKVIIFCFLLLIILSCIRLIKDFNVLQNLKEEKTIKEEIHNTKEENNSLKEIEDKKIENEEEEVSTMNVTDYMKLEANTIIDTTNLNKDILSQLFYSTEISEEITKKIQGISYVPNDSISLDELRYIRVLHIGFDNQTHIGELIVNKKIADDVINIMKELYENNYQIEKMILIDHYNADDNLSMEDNNSSAFNYRYIAGTTKLSNHSLGMAIDINPVYNPYIRKDKNGETLVEPTNSTPYADRQQDFNHKIDSNDLCYQLFKKYGFTWGGDWNTMKDYQHFETLLN